MSSRQNENKKKGCKAVASVLAEASPPAQGSKKGAAGSVPKKGPTNQLNKAGGVHAAEAAGPMPAKSDCPHGENGSLTGGKRCENSNGTNDPPAKQCLNMLEKKLRNLEKRKGKLDDYRAQLANGVNLNNDQLEAIAKYDVVIQNLEFARDLQKQFQDLSVELDKQAKKQARREAMERQRVERGRVREVVRLFRFLQQLGSEETRVALCSNDALGVSLENLEQIDEFYRLITVNEDSDQSVETQLDASASHIVNFLDGLDALVTGTTYRALLSLVQRISGSTVALTCTVNGHAGACKGAELAGGAQGGSAQPSSEAVTYSDYLDNGQQPYSSEPQTSDSSSS